MKLPLILISLDDATVGVYTNKKYLISEIEAPDVDNYRVFDIEAFELEIIVTRKQFLCLFLGYNIDVVLDVTSLKKDPDILIDYVTQNLDYFDIHIPDDKINNFPYLLDLLVKAKGYNKIF